MWLFQGGVYQKSEIIVFVPPLRLLGVFKKTIHTKGVFTALQYEQMLF